MISEAFDGAAPDLAGYSGKLPEEVTILAVPPGEAGDRFRDVVAEALPGEDFTQAPLPDDIVFYRECPRVEMAELAQLGEFGRAAADARAAERSPHSRIDIAWKHVHEE